uniref:BLOC-1 related complex subunit 8 n=6 Tax=Boreoeutheria TaxID=1437010 RepID=A0AAA9SCG1_BOVIN
MEEPEMQLKGKKVTDKFTESVYVLANEPSVALYRLQEHVRRSLPELAQHKADMQRWEEQSQGAIYTVEYACSAVKNLVDSSVYFRSVEGLLKQAISIRDHMNATAQGHRSQCLVRDGHVIQREVFPEDFAGKVRKVPSSFSEKSVCRLGVQTAHVADWETAVWGEAQAFQDLCSLPQCPSHTIWPHVPS